MGIPNIPEVPPNPSTEQLAQIVAQGFQEIFYLLSGFLSSSNAREFGGWQIGPTEMQSKDKMVGMSTEKTGTDDIRFWAGDLKEASPSFKVTESGIASLVSAVIKSLATGDRVVIDSTGFHTYDATGIERLTIGTTVAKGVKAITGRDTSGVAQSVYTYDTETVDGASRTGQYITAHGAYLLFSDDGDVRLQSAAGHGFRSISGTPEINDGFGWSTIAKKTEADARGFTLSYDSGTKNLSLKDKNGSTLSTVNLT